MCLVACSRLVIDSQSLIGDGVFLDLAMAVPSGVHLGDAGVGRRPMALVVAGNLRDQFVFLDLLQFYLQSFQNNHFIPVCLLISTYVAFCILIFH
jgi:hypothetical protein